MMHDFPSWDSYHTHLKKKNGNDELYKTSSEDSIFKNPREYFLEFDTPKASKTNRPTNWKPWPIDDKH